MINKKNAFVLFGLRSLEKVINEIIIELDANEICFDLKLILTEGITNAFRHGNNEIANLPIFLRYSYDNKIITFEIEDSGLGFENLIFPKDIPWDNILDESGRGMFLINSYSDSVNIINNKLILQKTLPKSTLKEANHAIKLEN